MGSAKFVAFVFFLLVELIVGIERSLDVVTYRFGTCGKSGQFGPTLDECQQFYSQSGSPITGNLYSLQPESSRIQGVQYFQVPSTDRYVVTASGGRGGLGVCTRWPGRSPIIRTTLHLQKGSILEVSVGHHGGDACSNNLRNVPLCNLDIKTIAEAVNCSSHWQNISGGSMHVDGGGGGGGGSLVRYQNGTVLVLVAGGGGESAQVPADFNESKNNSRRNVKDAALNPFARASGTRPINAGSLTAGRGGGYDIDVQNPAISVDGKEFSSSQFAVGGSDCFVSNPSIVEYFPKTVGGFGGGGGGCANGPGGGGYGGGSARDDSVTQEGQGGFPFNDPRTYEHLGWNYDSGFVSFREEDCGCAHNCTIDSNRSVFWCSCPDGTLLSPDGYGCHEESDLFLIASNSSESVQIADDVFGSLVLEPLSLMATRSVGLISLSADFQSSVFMGIPGQCGLVLLDSLGSIVGVIMYNSDSEQEWTTTIRKVVQNNYTFSIDPPVRVLAGSIDFAGVYLFYSEGTVCSIDLNVTANVSIKAGSPLGPEMNSPDDQAFVSFFQELLSTNATVATTSPTTPPTETPTPFPVWVYAAILGGVIALALVVIVTVCICVCACKCRRRKKVIVQNVKYRANEIYSFGANDDPQIMNRVNLAHKPADLNSYSTVKAFRRKSKLLTLTMPVDDMSKSLSMPRPYADLTVPNYGVEVPQGVDFSQYNQTRTEKDDTAWHVPRDTLTYMRELGEGEFGKVLLMSAKNIAGYQGNLPVAVKTLSKSRMKDIDKFMQEVNIMKKFTNPNIICLLGVCPAAEDAAPMMILELMPYGDLQSFLEANRPEAGAASRITVVEFFQFALDIANALEFLANNLYVHRDVAARNCLVGNELIVKLADFGMARGVKDKDLYRIAGKAKLPVKWMAPESLIYGEFTPASDVWSYGVLLWEICSYGSSPLKDYPVEDVVQMAESKLLAESHTRPADCPSELYSLMRRCLVHDASERPTAEEICATLVLYSNEEYRLEEVDTLLTNNGGYDFHRNTIIENNEAASDDEKTDVTMSLSPLSPIEPPFYEGNLSQYSLV